MGNEFVCGGLLQNNGEIGPILIKSYVELVALHNCTVVEGSLKISSFKDDLSKVSFPKLVEVTGYVLIHRLQGVLFLYFLDLEIKTIDRNVSAQLMRLILSCKWPYVQ